MAAPGLDDTAVHELSLFATPRETAASGSATALVRSQASRGVLWRVPLRLPSAWAGRGCGGSSGAPPGLRNNGTAVSGENDLADSGWSRCPGSTVLIHAVEFLSDEQVGAYGRFAGELSVAEVERFFYLDDADRDLIARRRSDHHRLGFAVQLGTVSWTGWLEQQRNGQ